MIVSYIIITTTLVFLYPTINRNAMHFRFDLLDSIVRYGSSYALDHPLFHDYRYYYIVLNTAGDIVYSSNLSETEESRLFEKRLVQRYFFSDSIPLITKLITLDEGDYDHNIVGANYYTAKRVRDQATGRTTFHIIIDKKGAEDFFVSVTASSRVIMKAVIPAIILGFIMIYFEVRPLRKAWFNQKRFVASVSHELRTPLTAIKTSIHMMDNKQYETVIPHERLVEIIQLETEHMEELVQALLAIARKDAKQKIISKEVFNLDSLLMDLHKIVMPLAAEKGVVLLPYVSQELMICADMTSVKIVVSALLKNAVQYTPEGGRIELGAKKTGNNAEITVSDEGIGIDGEQKKKIFKRFFRVDKYEKSENLGIGLYVANLFVKEHGGKIIVEDKAGGGTRFVVRLPLGQSLSGKSVKIT